MKFEIRTLAPKKLVGLHITMSIVDNKTGELWRNFMPRRKEIASVSNDLFSMQVYSADYSFANFNPAALFEKWAALEIGDGAAVPQGMTTFDLQGGTYAVFYYKGNPANGAEVFGYIFGTWLPASDFELDHRPHFEVLGERYKNNDPESEEEIWIPVKQKNNVRNQF